MVITAIVTAISGVLTWILGSFPSVTFPDFSTALSSIGDSRIWQYLNWANWYLPLDFALVVITARIALGMAYFGFEFLTWAATKLHILGGSS